MIDFSINVFELAETDSIHGLIGLDFLRCFNYLVRSAEGRILGANIKPLLRAGCVQLRR